MSAVQHAGVWASITDYDRARHSARTRYTVARVGTRCAGRRFSPFVAQVTNPPTAAIDEWIIARATEYEARADWLTSAQIASPHALARVIPIRPTTATEELQPVCSAKGSQ